MEIQCYSVKSNINNPKKRDAEEDICLRPKSISLNENNNMENIIHIDCSAKDAVVTSDLTKTIIPYDERICNIDSNGTMTRTYDDSSHNIKKREEIESANRVLFIRQQYPTIKFQDKDGKLYSISKLEH